MKEFAWLKRLRSEWLKLKIKKKIAIFTGFVFLIIIVSVFFDLCVVQFALGDFKDAMDWDMRSTDFMDAMEQESKCFKTYIKSPSDTALEELNTSIVKTKSAISRLPYEYESMSVERYAKTWSIKNGYAVYEQRRDKIIIMSEAEAGYIKTLYEVYDMQEFLQEYARVLLRYTLEDQNKIYTRKLPFIESMFYWVIVVGGTLLFCICHLSNLLHKTLITPIVNLLSFSKQIVLNNFYIEDVVVENEDEMGDLVKAFNKMKFATGEYINMLEEKRATLDLLHKEELEKLEMERQLESMKLELLKNQINPHFLFNTLNVIAGMANLEEADTTEKMINALSSLFRYNLKTPDAKTTLAQELRIASDYMYLQKMRFGSRIEYAITCEVDKDKTLVPTFTFQPLMENAIIHGISKKEEGGKIEVSIRKSDDMLQITVADTGIGMTQEELNSLREAFQMGETQRIGIGLGNIYKRIAGMYQNGKMEIDSKMGEGTTITIRIPQQE